MSAAPDDESVELAGASTALALHAPLAIATQEEYEEVGDYLRGVVAQRKKLEAKEDELLAPLQEAIAGIKGFFREPLTQLRNAESNARSAASLYLAEQEAARQKEQAEQRAAASKAATDLLRRAERTKNETRAAELREQADMAAAQVLAVAPAPKAAGISGVPRYSAVVEDFAKLVGNVALGATPLEALQPNQPYLNALARAAKDTWQPPPGVRLAREMTTTVRTK